MRYYKILLDNKIVGVCNELDFRTYQKKHNIVLACDISNASYLQYKDELYTDDWLKNDEANIAIRATICEIEKTIYDELHKIDEVIENTQEDEKDSMEYSFEAHFETFDVESAELNYIREYKIKEFSYECNNLIEKGIYVCLSDDEIHHFSLSLKDQINLISLSTMLSSDIEQIPYHQDGETCRYYSKQDMAKIIQCATIFKTYELAYFNSLRDYVNNVTDKYKLLDMFYGIKIPEEYKSDVLKNVELDMF